MQSWRICYRAAASRTEHPHKTKSHIKGTAGANRIIGCVCVCLCVCVLSQDCLRFMTTAGRERPGWGGGGVNRQTLVLLEWPSCATLGAPAAELSET